MENIVELENVYFRYSGSDEYALENITFKARKGEYILITGPSGCGKSTLTRVLNGLIPNFYEGELKGKIKVAGLDVRETPAYIMAKHVGTVFQDPENQLFLSTVEREIAFGLENLGFPRGEMRKKVENILKMFGLQELRNRAPFELSGGQQQKVAIASIIALQPEILILDEPTANLDPLSAEEVLSLVDKLVKELSMLAIVIEHRLEIALKYSTRMIIMDKGKIIADGNPREVILKDEAKKVGIPKVVEVYRRLSLEGVRLRSVPLSPSEFVTFFLEEVMSNGK
ncbi:MAG: energy-coupling factor ABC transporter ATP-binding protein [Thermofilum sp. ex4484_79]|nr:MAG: energy-coupling factor ABC transporter ATP-binding protein [Thermofilum sp. ex4484_79]